MEEKQVYSSTDAIKVEQICSALEENKIAFIKRTEGTGEYLKIAAGNLFNCNVNLFVSENDYKKANKIIAAIDGTSLDAQTVDIPDELKDIPEEEEKEEEVIFPVLLVIVILLINMH